MKQITVFIITVLLLGCISNEKNEDSKIKDQALIETMLSERFMRFQKSSNPIEQAKYYVENISDDAIWMPQNGKRLQGKVEVKEWAEWFFSNYQLIAEDDKLIVDNILISKNLAVRRFISGGYYIIKASGDTIPFDQKYEDVFLKENGEWKIASHTWSSNNMKQSVWNPECQPFSNQNLE